ncbi:MAG: bifunctional diaminohydroxyphosphoribosylaminopyrimidine deaminase/5-amino-6-(5-phosphoribosylamino)uracil reductase RibD [Pseudomonadota bacterium]
MNDADSKFMLRAFELAERGLYTTGANPRVGCVLVKQGQIIGEGWTQPIGQAHAEKHALANATDSVQGATAYVTLEPCSHYGRTPPCSDALIEAGIKRVVAASGDPNPTVSGTGFEALRAAGMAVDTGLHDELNQPLNCGFFSRMTRSRPWVRVKLAASLDGRTALADGESRWITSEASRADVQRWRARANCILTGVGTIIADDPRMTVRLPEERWTIGRDTQPLLAIVDSKCRTPLGAQIFKRDGKIVIYANTNKNMHERCEVVYHLSAAQTGQVNLSGVLRDLADREINEVHVEAGAELAGNLLKEGLIDELIVYIAPHLLGADARALFQFAGLKDMADRPSFRFENIQQIGPDVRLILAPESQST